MRILEIGCGPGVAAREVIARCPDCFVLALDRSPKAVAQAKKGCAGEIADGRIEVRQGAIEDYKRMDAEPPFDLAFALRVGVLDGRHPEAGKKALANVRAALGPGGRLYLDGVRRLVEA